jgi:hypothetical protein
METTPTLHLHHYKISTYITIKYPCLTFAVQCDTIRENRKGVGQMANAVKGIMIAVLISGIFWGLLAILVSDWFWEIFMSRM